MTARKRCGWVMFRECGELMYVRFSLRLNRAIYKSYAKLAILHGSKSWCLRESEMRI